MEYKKLGSDYYLQQCLNDMGDNFSRMFCDFSFLLYCKQCALFPEVTLFCVNDLRFITKVQGVYSWPFGVCSQSYISLYRESFAYRDNLIHFFTYVIELNGLSRILKKRRVLEIFILLKKKDWRAWQLLSCNRNYFKRTYLYR